jgi:hypothetical protein
MHTSSESWMRVGHVPSPRLAPDWPVHWLLPRSWLICRVVGDSEGKGGSSVRQPYGPISILEYAQGADLGLILSQAPPPP